jgi:hypothetical protein
VVNAVAVVVQDDVWNAELFDNPLDKCISWIGK